MKEFWDNSSKATKIRVDEVTRYNPNVPKELSEGYIPHDPPWQKQRAKVFSELLFCLKISPKKLACSYCAVGCKFEADEKKFKAIKEYPTIKGELC